MSIRPIPGHEGYFAREDGQIFSTWTLGPGANPNGLLRQMAICNSEGRAIVCIKPTGGKVKTRKVASLVLATFVGPRKPGTEACHFPDRNPFNNCIRNLRWDTKSANQQDRVIHGTSNHGERNGSAKLTKQKVSEIRGLRAKGRTYKSLAERYGVTLSNIQQICTYSIWLQ